ncbi:pyridoxamine 5'-phosphate oxidase family protein [Phenylobacterium sp. LjRoot219]|uniref:pyridoxamine 5'-phosphate oxidase family protein n=1 Tax=Phenylobacterium sp. LjRoot219 TaxID=3342283 RepID=UPI003ECD84CE
MTQGDPQDLLARFWRDLADLRTGMLGLATEHEGHAQPMTAHFEGEHGPLWFYAHKHSRIAMAADQSHAAVFHYIGRKHDLYACVHGEVAMTSNDDAINRFWSDEVARWYPQGRYDPELTLLCFTPSSAQIWLPSGGGQPTLFGMGRDREAPHEIRAEVRL